jgi:hypothetical protein
MTVLAASGSLEAGPEPEPDGVDWSAQSAVVVAMGTVPYGYSLDVPEVRLNSGELLVDVHVAYQSYENNFPDDNPVVVALVDGHGMNIVCALYDLDVPGLLSQAAVVSCGIARSRSASRPMGAGLGAAPTISMTWGSLKSFYR